MSFITHTAPRAGFAATLRVRARALLEHWRRAARTRAAVRSLNKFDDYLLRDIGLTRADIASGVRNGRAGIDR